MGGVEPIVEQAGCDFTGPVFLPQPSRKGGGSRPTPLQVPSLAMREKVAGARVALDRDARLRAGCQRLERRLETLQLRLAPDGRRVDEFDAHLGLAYSG